MSIFKLASIILAVGLLVFATPDKSVSQIVNEAKPEENPVGYWNLKAATFGGKQFWTDFRHANGWRIQQNSETGHFRLLDSSNVRHAWGNLAHCNLALDKRIAGKQAKPYSGKVVCLLHGLIRTNESMEPLAKHLSAAGYSTINVQYASTRKPIHDHAVALKSIIDHLGPEVSEINFVCHSMGNLVVRKYLYLNYDPLTRKQGDSRIKRMVMIGPPNQGSRMARLLKSSKLFQTVAGVSGMQLAAGWNKLEPTLATPEFEFGIIAGGAGI